MELDLSHDPLLKLKGQKKRLAWSGALTGLLVTAGLILVLQPPHSEGLEMAEVSKAVLSSDERESGYRATVRTAEGRIYTLRDLPVMPGTEMCIQRLRHQILRLTWARPMPPSVCQKRS